MVIICPTAVRFLSASSSVSSISRTALPSFAIPLRPPVTHLVPSLSGPPPTLLPGQKMNEHSEERAEEGVLEEALRSMKRIRLDNTESNTTGSDDKQQQDDDVAAFEARQQLLQDEADAMSTISTASSMKRGRASVPISGYNDDIMLPSSSPLERRHAASSSSNNHSCRRQRWIRVRDRVQQVSSTIYGASWSQVRQGSLRATGCVAGMAAQKVRSMVVGGVPPPSTAASSLPSSEGHAADDDGIVTTTTAALPVEAASEDGNNNAGACPCCCSSDPPTSVVGTSEDIDDGSNP
ncbi:hypothetical protein FOZ61_010982 [Perkinsus olseni]|uniref:Uncharacterized protein n=1 Tax=Perkinsus olseni TaxID=32597 RepID=A0A7J6M1A8_PEROL|nr:hypothetical protein FOZ61_010982 [Perkinsus olseni]